MLKKLILTLLVVTGTLVPSLAEDITMIVVPREIKPIRIAQDIARQTPVLLITYQEAINGTRLHAWNGETWIAISMKDYVAGHFFTNAPSHTIIVDSQKKPAPDNLIPDGSWCPAGHRLRSTDPRVIIHLLGLHYRFDYPTWKHFAARYGYTVEEVNPGRVNLHWWHYRDDEVIKQYANRALDTDLEDWYPLPIHAPKPAAPDHNGLKTARTGTFVKIPARKQQSIPSAIVHSGSAPTKEAVHQPQKLTEKIEKENPEPVPTTDLDPFSAEEIPAATVILAE